MQITILKARRITSSIDKLLKDLLPISRDRYGFREKNEDKHFIYDQVSDASENGDIKVSKIISDYEELLHVKYYLRNLVGNFNSQSEINMLQNKSKEIEVLNDGLIAVTKNFKIPAFNTINNKFSEGCSEKFLKNIKKEIQKNNNEIQNISDQCASINLTNKIDIDEKYVDILNNYDLLG